MALPYPGTLFGVLGNARAIYVYGLRGHALRSLDGGASWTELQTGTNSNLVSGTLLSDGSLVLASLGGELLRSSDDGASFQPLRLAEPMALYSAQASAPGSLLLSGSRGVRFLPVEPGAPTALSSTPNIHPEVTR